MTDLSKAPNINVLWAELIVEQLIRSGASCFCVSPGSRSTPLVAALARRKSIRIRSLVHFDERGAAFLALGYAKATGRAAICITTSGTAVANAFPAVIEAAHTQTPLMLLTADRPPELRDTGANQTIDQVKIFGDYTNWFFDLPCPTASIEPQMVLSTVSHAWYQAHRSPGGPVHINCMFREPLAPTSDGGDYSGYCSGLSSWLESKEPYGLNYSPRSAPDSTALDRVKSCLAESKKGLVMVGSLHSEKDARAVDQFVDALGWPALADVTSGLRAGADAATWIPYGSLLVGDEGFTARHRPDMVLQLGGPLVSRRLLEFVRSSRPKHIVSVKSDAERQDPLHQVTLRIESDLVEFCEAMIPLRKPDRNAEWLKSWQKNARAAGGVIKKLADDQAELSEPGMARLISQLIPEGSGLALASSMPVRDMDGYADDGGSRVRVLANRGSSGIDGTVASAIGFGLGLNQPVTLLIGDLALLHDINSLALVRELSKPLIVVAINNRGGGIFHFLPVADFPELFEPFFGAPHKLTFEPAARLFGLGYKTCSTPAEFSKEYKNALKSGNSTLIEVATDRKTNFHIHQAWQKQISAALDECAG